MYLTRMQLDLTKRNTMKALSMPNIMHGAVENAFAGERKRRLWRIDSLYGNRYLMILSEDRPDMKVIVSQFGCPDMENAWETKNYTPLLNRITEGSVWHFRLTANPTKSRGMRSENGEIQRGKVFAHKTIEYQMQWLKERAPKYGFELKKDAGREILTTVVNQQWFSFLKGAGRKKVSLLSVTYEGILTVTDAQQFRELLICGMGRGKAYGNGMMTVMRVREVC